MAHIEDRWHRRVDGQQVRSERYGAGLRWRARWLDPARKPRTKSFERKIDAERFLAGLAADALKGTYIDPRAGETTVKEYAQVWLPAQRLAATSVTNYGGHLERHVYPTLGDIPLKALRPTMVSAWATSLTAEPNKLAASTASTVWRIFATVMKAAVRDDMIGKSPCIGVKPPRANDRQINPDTLLTLKQVLAWDEKMPAPFKGMVLVAAGTGIRQGELLGLRLDGPDPMHPARTLRRVDLLRRELHIVEQIQTPPKDGQPYYCDPKSAKSTRRIPIEATVVNAIAAHLEAYPAVDGEPIFRSALGLRIRRPRFQYVWSTAAKAAGLPEGTHWHMLRDFYASALIRGGADMKVIMEYLGHASAEETMRTYARLWPDSQDRAREAIVAAFTPQNEKPAKASRVPSTSRRRR